MFKEIKQSLPPSELKQSLISHKLKIKSILKFVLPTLIFGFIIFNIYNNKNQVLSFWDDFKILPLIISFLFTVLIYFEAAFNYHVLVKVLNFPLNFTQSLYIFIVSNASRYIPGSIWQYIGRVEMAKNIGKIPRKISILSLILEVFLLVNAALIVSLVALPFFQDQLNQNYLVIFLIPLTLVFLHPKIAKNLIAIVAKATGRNSIEGLAEINFNGLIPILPYFILNFFLNGLALFFLAKSIFPELGLENLLLFSGIFAFSWVVGYLSFLAPAGLGVSDFLLTYLLSFRMPFALASTIALSYRIFLTISELLVFTLVMRITLYPNIKTLETKRAWEERSRKFGYKVEGVATKSLPPVINQQLDNWMLENIRSVINKVLSKKRIRVLDLGCGYGRLSKPLLKEFRNLKTYGIDISKNYVDLYNRDLNPRGNAAEGDIKKLPYKNNYFDVVFIVTTLMYSIKIEDQKKALAEIIRVLNPRGKAIIIERSPSGYFLFTLGGLVNLIRGKKNREIKAVSIDKNILEKNIRQVNGKVEIVCGIPFLSLFMPYSIFVFKVSANLTNQISKQANFLDKKMSSFLWPSLYLCYTVSKSTLKK